MFYCNMCGQSLYLSDDNFLEYINTSGWESQYVDPNNGDYVDYANGENTDSEHESYECPYCCSRDIDSRWDGDREEAINKRARYQEDQEQAQSEMLERQKLIDYEMKAKDPNRQWDMESNIYVTL